MVYAFVSKPEGAGVTIVTTVLRNNLRGCKQSDGADQHAEAEKMSTKHFASPSAMCEFATVQDHTILALRRRVQPQNVANPNILSNRAPATPQIALAPSLELF
jgi:hypothetical protein